MSPTDFVKKFQGKPHLAEKIFSYLEFPDLGKVQLVNKGWHEAVNQGCVWNIVFQQKSRFDPMWKQIKTAKILAGDGEAPGEDLLTGREKCRQMMQTVKKPKENWMSGDYKKRQIKFQNIGSVRCVTMDDELIVLGTDECDKIIVLNRKSLKSEKNFSGHGDTLSYLKLDGDQLVSASRYKFKVWDRDSRTMLHEIKFPKEIERGIGWYTDLGFTSGYGLFLISSYVVRRKEDFFDNKPMKLSVWRMEQSPIVEKNIRLVHQDVFQPGLDSKETIITEKYIFVIQRQDIDSDAESDSSPGESDEDSDDDYCYRRKRRQPNHSQIQVLSSKNFEELFVITDLHFDKEIRNGVLTFFNGLLVIQLYTKIRFFDVEKRTFQSMTHVGGFTGYLGFNSTFAIGCDFYDKYETFVGIWDVKATLNKFPTDDYYDDEDFRGEELPHSYKDLNGRMSMDELSVAYYASEKKKLVVLDFLP